MCVSVEERRVYFSAFTNYSNPGTIEPKKRIPPKKNKILPTQIGSLKILIFGNFLTFASMESSFEVMREGVETI